MSIQTQAVTKGLFVTFEAKPGREAEVEAFLQEARTWVDDEPGTTAWFAVRLGPRLFGIVDAFPDEDAREAHVAGKVATMLMVKAGELFEPPEITKLDVIASRLPA